MSLATTLMNWVPELRQTQGQTWGPSRGEQAQSSCFAERRLQTARETNPAERGAPEELKPAEQGVHAAGGTLPGGGRRTFQLHEAGHCGDCDPEVCSATGLKGTSHWLPWGHTSGGCDVAFR